jgi:hypothetical protein
MKTPLKSGKKTLQTKNTADIIDFCISSIVNELLLKPFPDSEKAQFQSDDFATNLYKFHLGEMLKYVTEAHQKDLDPAFLDAIRVETSLETLLEKFHLQLQVDTQLGVYVFEGIALAYLSKCLQYGIVPDQEIVSIMFN